MLSKEGQVYAFGSDEYGQVGCGHHSEIEIPTLIPALIGKNVKRISCGKASSCCITESHELYCWGYLVNTNPSSGRYLLQSTPVPTGASSYPTNSTSSNSSSSSSSLTHPLATSTPPMNDLLRNARKSTLKNSTPTIAKHCVVQNTSPVGMLKSKYEFQIIAQNASHERQIHGGDVFRVTFTNEDGKQLKATCHDNQDGSYTVHFTPFDVGRHHLAVSLNSLSVATLIVSFFPGLVNVL